jgi:hypothetical protein
MFSSIPRKFSVEIASFLWLILYDATIGLLRGASSGL